MEFPTRYGYEHLHVDRDFSLLDGFATHMDMNAKMDEFQIAKLEKYYADAQQGLADMLTFMKPNPSLWDIFEKPKKQKRYRSIDDPWEAT